MNAIRTMMGYAILAMVAGVAWGQLSDDYLAGDGSEPTVTVVTRTSTSRGWIGVRISEVPDMLTEHLGLEKGQGVLAASVLEDSPAAKAGIVKGDVILAADGKKVADGPELVEIVSAKKPGQKVRLTLVHRGKPVQRQVEVSGGLWPKEAEDGQGPVVGSSKTFRLKQGKVEVGPDGKITMKIDGEKVELPQAIQRMLRQGRQGMISIESFPFQASRTRTVTRDTEGGKIKIEQRGDGSCIVTRTKGGQESRQVYENLEAMKKSDPKAHEIWTEILESDKTLMLPNGPQGAAGLLTRKQMEQLKRQMEKMPRHIEQQLGERALESLGQGERFVRWLTPSTGRRTAAGTPEMTRRFDVDAEGRVTVHVHRDGSELTQTFESVAQMKAKAPELHEHYRKLLTAK